MAPAPVHSWSGCYVGGNLGGSFTSASVSGTAGTLSSDGSAFAGGGQIGCDYQFAPNWVVGFRNMFDGATGSRSGTLATGPLAGDVVNFNNQWFDTLTARLGYTWAPDWMIYFQGGAAWSHNSTNITFAGVQVGQTSQTRTGWTVGGGVEWMFMPHWSAFLEGNYMDYGNTSGTATQVGACAAGCAFSAKSTAGNVLVGVNYRFY
jgi:outer membrane immunogenic protein